MKSICARKTSPWFVRLLFAGFMVSTMALVAKGQVVMEDALANAKNLPPSLTTVQAQELNKAVLVWRMKLLNAMHETYAESRKEIQADLAKLDAAIEEEQASLPVEVRFTNAESRSQLVGRVLQLILETRLEIATNDSLLDLLTKTEAERSSESEEVQQLEADLQIAKVENEGIARELEQMLVLRERGLVEKTEALRLQSSLEVAQLKLRKMEQAVANARKRPASATAKRLSDLRLETQPLRAKLTAAEAFLETFNSAASKLQKVESLHRERELYGKDLMYVAGEIGNVSRELVELELLSKLIEQDGAAQPSQEKDK
jgi:hypothetical protein